jgi:hypothetical protein
VRADNGQRGSCPAAWFGHVPVIAVPNGYKRRYTTIGGNRVSLG